MGYIRYYNFILLEGSKKEFKNLIEDLKGKCVVFGEVFDDCASSDAMCWTEWREDMTELSKKYPTLLVEVSGDGEASDDLWEARFKNGAEEFQTRIDNVPTFRELLTSKEKATFKRYIEKDIKELARVCKRIFNGIQYEGPFSLKRDERIRGQQNIWITPVSNTSGDAVLVSWPFEGQPTRALLIPGENFKKKGIVEEELRDFFAEL